MRESRAEGRADGSGIVRSGTPLRDEAQFHGMDHGNRNGRGSMSLPPLTICGEDTHMRQAGSPSVVSASCQRKWRRPIIVHQNERILHLAQADFRRVVLRAGALQSKSMLWIAAHGRPGIWDGW